jgi:hypothetical protein
MAREAAKRQSGVWLRFGVGAAWACGLAVALSTACGSDDQARSSRPNVDAGAGGEDMNGSAASSGGGVAADSGAGGVGVGVGVGGEPAGEAGMAGVPSVAGAPSEAGAAGGGGAGGGPSEECEAVTPEALQGFWKSDCNGYSCAMTILASGELAAGCSNGQFETGTLDDEGALETLGQGGPYSPYSTSGTLTANGCDSLTRDYVGQIPPNTGPEQTYSCELVRATACAPTLREALAGDWDTICGSSTCLTTFTVEGAMSSTCSNGQASTGTVAETGAFADMGGGGGFDDYSTEGVIKLGDDCDSFLMPYTWQMPPHQGTLHSAQCAYTRHVD